MIRLLSGLAADKNRCISAVVVAAAISSGKSKKSLDQMLFGIFASKDQGNDQTQNADSGHQSQDGWNAESTL